MFARLFPGLMDRSLSAPLGGSRRDKVARA